MSRPGRLAAALALALTASGALGCAHCDTCDDFPAPCLGGDCLGGGPPPMVGSPVAAGPAVESAPVISTPAPASAQPGPFSAPAGGAADSPPAPGLPGPNG